MDLLEENVDLVVRLGDPGNSAFLSARHLGHQRVVSCAAPAYLAARGRPATIADLAQHDCITFGQGGKVLAWMLCDEEGRTVNAQIRGRHTISDGDALRAAVLQGLGVAQFPTWLVADALQQGLLQTVLAPQGVEGSSMHAL